MLVLEKIKEELNLSNITRFELKNKVKCILLLV